MEVKVRLNNIIIKDEETGKTFRVRTLRTAEDIAGYVDESEKDQMVFELERIVSEALHQTD
jgi:hypothetical protein